MYAIFISTLYFLHFLISGHILFFLKLDIFKYFTLEVFNMNWFSFPVRLLLAQFSQYICVAEYISFLNFKDRKTEFDTLICTTYTNIFVYNI